MSHPSRAHTAAPTHFAPPGPGAWELDATHFQRPVTPFFAAMYGTHFVRGFAEGAEAMGLLLERFDWKPVNGFMYLAPRPVGAPARATSLPPKLVFQLLLRVHPEMRRRRAASRTVFDRKPWRDDLARWDNEWKPRAIERQTALGRIDPTTLTDAALRAHFAVLRDNVEAMMWIRGRLTIPSLLALGDFIAHAREWTGLASGPLLALLAGASPVSAGVSDELDAVRVALLANAAARSALAADADPAAILETLRCWHGDVGDATTAYLELVSERIIGGYDMGDARAIEVPALIVRALRAQLDAHGLDDDRRVADATRAVRSRVPEAMRPTFDELLAEARGIYRLRDERGLFTEAWALGLMRRALLEAGRRLTAAGRLERAEHLVFASYDEWMAILAGAAEPTGAELRRRAEHRDRARLADAPAILRATPAGPPPIDWLPADLVRSVRAVSAVVDAIFHETPPPSSGAVVRGLGASSGSHEGIARLVHGPEDFRRLRQGDVLVTSSTSPSFNVVLPTIGALVTDRGGTLSHAAIVAREYGIPGVVATRDATLRIPDGARVRVDGDAGEVRILP